MKEVARYKDLKTKKLIKLFIKENDSGLWKAYMTVTGQHCHCIEDDSFIRKDLIDSLKNTLKNFPLIWME
jgi:hypothetical protein